MDSPHGLIESRHLQCNPWTWKPHSSEEGFLRVSGDHLVLNPIISFGTVAWRGRKQLTESTTAYWEVQIDGRGSQWNFKSVPCSDPTGNLLPEMVHTSSDFYGTSVQFGIGRRQTLTQKYDFVDLLGGDDNSYGLNYRGYAQRSGMKTRVCIPLEGRDVRIGLFFDGPNQSLSFFMDNDYLCTPFVDIDLSETLYPFVSSTAQCTTMQLRNQYSRDQVLSLFSLTRRKVLDSFDSHFVSSILPKDILLSSRIP
ncbi:hypothetical protein PMAYCL1PPCAC_18149 [Pristionchus mayeri]|uniref:B30.2/SPRY domain-containing protein n=1 Tax=Pristionchus mayeri TaxID=1317129 RepID=A0AAN5I159_9BILA|nr:hypothetical protein PMAYCL1PPCAC_18149 [Pristionchus mayeri]